MATDLWSSKSTVTRHPKLLVPRSRSLTSALFTRSAYCCAGQSKSTTTSRSSQSSLKDASKGNIELDDISPYSLMYQTQEPNGVAIIKGQVLARSLSACLERISRPSWQSMVTTSLAMARDEAAVHHHSAKAFAPATIRHMREVGRRYHEYLIDKFQQAGGTPFGGLDVDITQEHHVMVEE